ncbi:unnamed protein product, partial [Nesidiocoris tenuis]
NNVSPHSGRYRSEVLRGHRQSTVLSILHIDTKGGGGGGCFGDFPPFPSLRCAAVALSPRHVPAVLRRISVCLLSPLGRRTRHVPSPSDARRPLNYWKALSPNGRRDSQVNHRRRIVLFRCFQPFPTVRRNVRLANAFNKTLTFSFYFVELRMCLMSFPTIGSWVRKRILTDNSLTSTSVGKVPKIRMLYSSTLHGRDLCNGLPTRLGLKPLRQGHTIRARVIQETTFFCMILALQVRTLALIMIVQHHRITRKGKSTPREERQIREFGLHELIKIDEQLHHTAGASGEASQNTARSDMIDCGLPQKERVKHCRRVGVVVT